MPGTPSSPLRWSFAGKATGAALLVALAQWLFYGDDAAATLGAFAVIWCAALAVSVRRFRRGAPAAMLAVAAALGLILIEDFSLLAGPDKDRLRLTVTDNGAGIADADRDQLFEPFYTTRRATGGTGLGLTIARSLLEAHGASISPLDGPGGAFAITLPFLA